MSERAVLLDRQGAVATLKLNRPASLNALSPELLDDLLSRLDDINSDRSIRAMVLTGAGRGFCSGMDLKSPVAHDLQAHEGQQYLQKVLTALVPAMMRLRVPTVSAVNGVAAGGGVGLALSADVVYASDAATFVQVFGPQLAVVPDVGSTWFLPRAMGRAKALPLMLLGQRMSAADAVRWRLIWEAVPDADLLATATACAAQLARGPIEAFVEIRRLANRALTASLPEQLESEFTANSDLTSQPDYHEGVAAFLQKRPPKYRGTQD